MPTVELNITGGAYKHKSLPLSAQKCVNFYPQLINNPKAKSRYILHAYPGKKLFGTQSGGSDRGMYSHKNILYKVTGTKLYSVNSSGTHTELGDIAGTERCVFAGIGDNVVIVTDGTAYQYNGSTVTQIADVDLETPNACAHLNNQIIYDGDGGRFAVSDVGDATSINGLNYATAESNADDIIRPFVFNQTLYLCGEESIEPWWNSGQGNPPFDRIQGGIINVGIAGVHSICNSRDKVYFLANDHMCYALRGSSYAALEPLFPEPLAEEVRGYGRISDAIMWSIDLDGTNIIYLTFPFQDKTWAFVEGGEWFQLSSGLEGGRDLANSYVYAFRKHLIADYTSGNIYELDYDTYTDNGETIVRTRDTAPIHGGLVQQPGKCMEMERFELILERGIGIMSGQGEDPLVSVSFSFDGGFVFGTEMNIPVGRLGQRQWKAEIFNIGQFEECVIRVRVSDPVAWSIHSAAADLEVCI